MENRTRGGHAGQFAMNLDRAIVKDTIIKFLAWWWKGLAETMPPALHRYCSERGDKLHFDISANQVRIWKARNGKTSDLIEVPMDRMEEFDDYQIADFKPTRTTLEMKVSPELGLAKEVELPLAARENLRQALAYEMHRFTPFSADDVYYDYRITGTTDHLIRVHLAVVPRRLVSRVTEWLSGWDLRLVSGLMPLNPKNTPEDKIIFRFCESGYRFWHMRKVSALFLAVNMVLAATVIALPQVLEKNRLDGLHARLDQLLSGLEQYSVAYGRTEDMEEQRNFLASRINTRVSALQLLEVLTDQLPDDTWIMQLELREGVVHLQGYSSKATALVGILEASSMFDNPQFSSPVIRDEAMGKDRFHLSVQVAVGES